jgi:hypothetical protein
MCVLSLCPPDFLISFIQSYESTRDKPSALFLRSLISLFVSASGWIKEINKSNNAERTQPPLLLCFHMNKERNQRNHGGYAREDAQVEFFGTERPVAWPGAMLMRFAKTSKNSVDLSQR